MILLLCWGNGAIEELSAMIGWHDHRKSSVTECRGRACSVVQFCRWGGENCQLSQCMREMTGRTTLHQWPLEPHSPVCGPTTWGGWGLTSLWCRKGLLCNTLRMHYGCEENSREKIFLLFSKTGVWRQPLYNSLWNEKF